MSKNETVELSDFELDQLLSYASHPIPAADFQNRLFEKLENFVLPSNVIAFPRARKTSLWLAGVPLAASLMLGLWLGSNEAVADYLPFSTDTLTQSVSVLISPNSNDDVVDLTEDNLS